jgi:hypothetical protein
MADAASSWIFSISPGSSAIFLSSASISADKLFSSASSAAFLLVQLWLSFVQQLVGKTHFSELVLWLHNEHPNLRWVQVKS